MDEDDRTFRVNFTSEGVGRLRERVKEKLKEFMGDYTDDTLVEYVIVLLKNGRRKDEAKSELNVFLGDDSDSFVNWLWDHLGSNLNSYVQQRELHPDGAPKTRSSVGEQDGRTEFHQIESDAEKEKNTSGKRRNREWRGLKDANENETSLHHSFMDDNVNAQDEPQEQDVRTESHHIESDAEKGKKASGKRRNREWRGLKDVNENETTLHYSFMDDTVNAQDEPRQRVCRTKRSLSPRPTIEKKRRRHEERQPKKREVSQTTVSAPRRLLQFAVRDAVATSRPSNSIMEPSSKRLRSVVSTSTEDAVLEERPLRRVAPEMRTAMSAAIRAVEEAVKDVRKVRSSRNVFDRLGHATDVSNSTNHLEEHQGLAEDGVIGDFSDGRVDVDLAYQRQNGDSMRRAENSSFHDDTIVSSDLGYDGESYDDADIIVQRATDIHLPGTSGVEWVEDSLIQYRATDGADERTCRPRKDLHQAPAVPGPSLKNTSSVGPSNRKPQYQEVTEVHAMDNHKKLQDNDTVAAKSQVWLMKENSNPRVTFNGNAKSDTGPQYESQKTQTSTGLYPTGPPTEDADSRTIFVSNVHFAATKDSLSRHFNKFGEVLKVIILTDPATGQPKGSAYIEFMRKEAAEQALSLDGTSFMSRIVKIVRKSSAQPEAASAVTWPRIARASQFPVPRFGRSPFARGVPSSYRARMPIKPGARSFQWKRAQPTEGLGQASSSIVPPPPSRSLTYVRPEPKTEAKTNESSSTL
ncbi:UNVERIFIED_CONTAM: putative RNA-binding protein RbpA [Sesamum radiatum]|uniref:RNA-binding protein RbpA n=1 Tax=Sesamum radiatum TaxID=300843 RepID=A0AAW2VMH6_SESRA